MNLDKFNEWLTLIANLGVLIGIFVVAVELQQTQIQMQGESSTMRAEMARQNNALGLELGLRDFTDKIENGEEHTPEEINKIRTYFNSMLRYYENLHYQKEIGILDDEIWASNVRGSFNMCRSSAFSFIYPNGFGGASFRESFVEFMSLQCYGQ